MATRKIDWINNFWKAIAHDPATLRRTWESLKEIMAPSALTRRKGYCSSCQRHEQLPMRDHIAHRVRAQKGMTDQMFHELQAVIGMANETNKMVTGYQVELDEQFKGPLAPPVR
jgi:hypothetical protein